MNHADDPDLLNGCREAANRRFQDKILPDWANRKIGTGYCHPRIEKQ